MYQVQSDSGLTHQIVKSHLEKAIKHQVQEWDWVKINEYEYSLIVGHQSYHIFLEQLDIQQKKVKLYVNKSYYNLSLEEPIDVLLKKMGIDLTMNQKVEPLKAPMPGLVLKILVEEGQAITEGTPLLILEAMKMENIYKATADATISKILVQEGQAVEKSTILIELE